MDLQHSHSELAKKLPDQNFWERNRFPHNSIMPYTPKPLPTIFTQPGMYPDSPIDLHQDTTNLPSKLDASARPL